jgi:hypothetical protein
MSWEQKKVSVQALAREVLSCTPWLTDYGAGEQYQKSNKETL